MKTTLLLLAAVLLPGCTANIIFSNGSKVEANGIRKRFDIEAAGVKANTDVRNEK